MSQLQSDKHHLDIWFSQYCWQNIYFYMYGFVFWVPDRIFVATCKKSTIFVFMFNLDKY